jgi:hypothetical protein
VGVGPALLPPIPTFPRQGGKGTGNDHTPQSAHQGGGVQGEGIMSYPSTYATAIGLPGEPVAPLSRSGLKI